MRTTCNHPQSSYGIPVILADDGSVMDYGPGLTAGLQKLGWSRADFARHCGYSTRSVEKFWQGVVPPAATLNMLGVALDLRAPTPEQNVAANPALLRKECGLRCSPLDGPLPLQSRNRTRCLTATPPGEVQPLPRQPSTYFSR